MTVGGDTYRRRERCNGFVDRLKAHAAGVEDINTIAAKLKLNRQVVARWYAGESEPTLANVIKLSELLGVTPNDLLV